jgi:L-lactate dehydrogenase complex protein LldG
MPAREKILNRLRNKARPGALPPPWRSRRQFDDLSTRFVQSLTAAKGEAWRADSFEDALNLISGVLHEISARAGLVDYRPPLSTINPSRHWPEVLWHVAGRPAEEGQALRSFAASADLGLSVADAALAETGTVVINCGPDSSRLTGLLPPVHLVLVPASRLTTDLFTWTAGRPEEAEPGNWPASITLISGPSKTADIEQTMAIGVHGPKRFIAVLYED